MTCATTDAGEYYEEGTKQDICVFGAGYYRKENTLILSARIDGQIVETVEVDLRTLKVVQSKVLAVLLTRRCFSKSGVCHNHIGKTC